MELSRRAVLAIGAAMGLAGCGGQSNRRDATESQRNAETDRIPWYINNDGTVGANVDNDMTKSSELLVTDQALWNQHIVTSEGHVIDPSNYADWGEAINAARNAVKVDGNNTKGVVHLPRTDGKIQYQTPIEISNQYWLKGVGGRGHSQGAATWLEYAGDPSSAAVIDTRQSATTHACKFYDLRIDTVGGANCFDLFAPQRFEWHNFYTNGNSEGGSVAVDITNDGGQTGHSSWRNSHFMEYENAFSFQRTDAEGSAIVSGIWDNCIVNSSVDGAINWIGDFGSCVFQNTLSSDSDICFQPTEGGHVWIYMFTEQAGTMGVDLSNVDRDTTDCLYLGGTINGGRDGVQFDDPHSKFNALSVNGIGTRIVSETEYIDPVIVNDKVRFSSNENGNSQPAAFLSNDGTNWNVQNRGGSLVFRDSTTGVNQFSFKKNGQMRAETGPITVTGDKSRKFRGTYAEHPNSASNGDMWYVDGSGTPDEGYYGMKSENVGLIF